MKRKSTLVDSVSAEPEVCAVGRKRQFPQSNGANSAVGKKLSIVHCALSIVNYPLSIVNCTLLIVFCLFFGGKAWGQTVYTSYTYDNGTSSYASDQSPAKLIDNQKTYGSKWCVTSFSSYSPIYVEFHSAEPIVPIGYVMTTGGDCSSYTGRNPRSWTIKAKRNSGDSWTTIETQTSNATLQDVNLTDYTFSLSDSKVYQYFRFEVSAIASGSTFQLTELQFKVFPCACTTLTSPADGAEINTASPTLSWDAVDNATSYHIYLSATPEKPASYSYTTTSTSITASNIPYGITYCWVVPCVDGEENPSCNSYTSFVRTCPATITAPTITANADLNNLVCGQNVTLTANGDYADYRWYSDAACTTQVGSGQTYSFQAGNSPITIYCKSACVSAPADEVAQHFVYTGSVQTYSVPSGVQSLKLEVWGAQGGNNTVEGGMGGYSVGVLNNLSGISNLYVYVGQQSTSTAGGWNGGGGMTNYGKGGGGATDISLHNYTYNTTDHYNDRIIVAGGGGGAGYSSCYGGYGGGETGGAGATGSNAGGGGGSQTSGGSCSTSGNAGLFGSASTNSSHNGGGGGGGWYGGGAGEGGSTDSGAGGGSGFVWTSTTASNVPSGYNVSSTYYLADAQTIAGNTSFPAPNGGTETGHTGNGYARITYSTPEEVSLSSPTSVTASAPATPATPTVSVASACPGEDVVLTVTNAVNGLTYGWWDNSSCTGNPLHEGTTYTIDNMQNNATYYVRAYNGSLNPVHNFDYTGAEQTLTVPSNVSSVTLEVWGAQGGGQPFISNTNAGVGGLGGYSIGTMPVQGNETLYVYVGGHGESTGDGTGRGDGGWNGGGCTYTSDSGDPANGGGGATDIRLNGTTYYDRIIVAGGGGGGGEDGEQGGYGGGLSGSGDYSATQTTAGNGGIFGAGAHTGYDGGGAGGGWYGGGANGGSQTIPSSDTNSDNNGGSGGSGYVWTSATASNVPSGYNVPSSYYLTDAQTIAGNTSFPAPEGGNETGHTGNGYARITFNVAAPTCMSAIGTVAVELGTPPTFTLTADNSVSCNQTPVTFTINNPSNGIVRYEWSDGVNTTETTSTTYTVTPGSTTTYTVSAFNSYCSASQSYTITVDAPGVTLTGSDNGDCVNAGTDVTLSFGDCPSSLNMENGTVTLAPGCSFNYYDHNGSSSNYVNYEDYTQTFTSADGGPITIEFSNVGAESCCDYIYLYDGEDDTGASLFGDILYNMSTGVTYTANSGSLTIHFTSDVSNVGSGWEATISTATLNYAWSNGASDQTITVTPSESTTYTVTVTGDGYSCPAIWDYTVKVKPTPSLTTDESPICLGAEATLTAGGAGTNGTYNWGEGYVSENTNVVLPTNNTTYRVTVKEANGCTASSYVDQEVQMAPGNTPMTHVVQGHIWTGRVSSDWNVPRNWVVFTGGGSGYTIAENAPTASDQVVIRSGSTCIDNQPSVSTNSTASNVIIRDGRTLTVEGSLTLAVNGDIDIENGGELTFSGSGMVSVTGDANIASGASVTFGNKDTLNVAGAFELNGSMVFPDRDTTPALRLGGNLTINNGSSLGTYGTLVFAGNGPQVVENNTTDTLRVRNNVRLNMHHSRAGVPHTEFPDGTIFSKATIFEYGIMDGDVIFDGTGRAIVCGGYESYASGRIEKRGSGNKFTFPTGDDNVLGSVTATISSGKKAYAKFHHWSGDNGDGSYGFGLDVIPRWWNVADMCGEDPFNHVSNFEYWDVSSREELSDVMLMTNAATSAEHFGDESAFVDADIQVAAYKNGCWSNYGGTATISDPDHNVIIIEGARIPIDPHRAAADFLITLGSKSNATVLPIELASVTATCDGRSTLIEWSTASERNNDYFSLERSDDAINFVEVARVAGAGNSIEPIDYTYNDYGIHGGDNYYRLVQVDYDGTRTVSEVVVANCIEESEGDPDVMAYPNPFSSELTVVLDNFGNRAATIEVYDMLGKLIYTNKISAPQNSYETILNLSNLPPAAYTVRVSTNDFVINRNVVKN